ncbi:unnamed protein product [Amoebophrya sp. A120]|nr:unnamed protein product [Amoebophrya sp. A120]|eukprot:GSA120T00022626001.1
MQDGGAMAKPQATQDPAQGYAVTCGGRRGRRKGDFDSKDAWPDVETKTGCHVGRTSFDPTATAAPARRQQAQAAVRRTPTDASSMLLLYPSGGRGSCAACRRRQLPDAAGKPAKQIGGGRPSAARRRTRRDANNWGTKDFAGLVNEPPLHDSLQLHRAARRVFTTALVFATTIVVSDANASVWSVHDSVRPSRIRSERPMLGSRTGEKIPPVGPEASGRRSHDQTAQYSTTASFLQKFKDLLKPPTAAAPVQAKKREPQEGQIQPHTKHESASALKMVKKQQRGQRLDMTKQEVQSGAGAEISTKTDAVVAAAAGASARTASKSKKIMSSRSRKRKKGALARKLFVMNIMRKSSLKSKEIAFDLKTNKAKATALSLAVQRDPVTVLRPGQTPLVEAIEVEVPLDPDLFNTDQSDGDKDSYSTSGKPLTYGNLWDDNYGTYTTRAKRLNTADNTCSAPGGSVSADHDAQKWEISFKDDSSRYVSSIRLFNEEGKEAGLNGATMLIDSEISGTNIGEISSMPAHAGTSIFTTGGTVVKIGRVLNKITLKKYGNAADYPLSICGIFLFGVMRKYPGTQLVATQSSTWNEVDFTTRINQNYAADAALATVLGMYPYRVSQTMNSVAGSGKNFWQFQFADGEKHYVDQIRLLNHRENPIRLSQLRAYFDSDADEDPANTTGTTFQLDDGDTRHVPAAASDSTDIDTYPWGTMVKIEASFRKMKLENTDKVDSDFVALAGIEVYEDTSVVTPTTTEFGKKTTDETTTMEVEVPLDEFLFDTAQGTTDQGSVDFDSFSGPAQAMKYGTAFAKEESANFDTFLTSTTRKSDATNTCSTPGPDTATSFYWEAAFKNSAIRYVSSIRLFNHYEKETDLNGAEMVIDSDATGVDIGTISSIPAHPATGLFDTGGTVIKIKRNLNKIRIRKDSQFTICGVFIYGVMEAYHGDGMRAVQSTTYPQRSDGAWDVGGLNADKYVLNQNASAVGPLEMPLGRWPYRLARTGETSYTAGAASALGDQYWQMRFADNKPHYVDQIRLVAEKFGQVGGQEVRFPDRLSVSRAFVDDPPFHARSLTNGNFTLNADTNSEAEDMDKYSANGDKNVAPFPWGTRLKIQKEMTKFTVQRIPNADPLVTLDSASGTETATTADLYSLSLAGIDVYANTEVKACGGDLRLPINEEHGKDASGRQSEYATRWVCDQMEQEDTDGVLQPFRGVLLYDRVRGPPANDTGNGPEVIYPVPSAAELNVRHTFVSCRQISPAVQACTVGTVCDACQSANERCPDGWMGAVHLVRDCQNELIPTTTTTPPTLLL